MRFDDRIATAMAMPATGPAGSVARWRQIVDLVAQAGADADRRAVERALAFARELSGAVPLAERARTARALASMPVSPAVVRLFAEDHPSVSAPLIAGARLDAEAWVGLVPLLGPPARALLRHRRDLDPAVRRALETFGRSDLVLESPPNAEAAPSTPALGAEQKGRAAKSQISELVARIEAYRRTRRSAPATASTRGDRTEEGGDGFRWETGGDGTIRWVDGVPRGALIGQTIAVIADRGQFGVDGQAAGAFEKRAPFRDARLSVAGDGPASGDWRISGVPVFDPHRGGFLGYRGTARRPRIDEMPPGGARAASGVFGTEFPADALRQLIHELRTPLNAIVGFAEMIEGQHMGPAAQYYRGRATDIVAQARELLSAVDDLDTAARIETRGMELGEGHSDAVAILTRLHDSYERVARQRGAAIAIEIQSGLPPAGIAAETIERMFARLLAATVGLAQDGERIGATLALDEEGAAPLLCFAIDRPSAILGTREQDLLDPGYSPQGDWPSAPALGLGFALRLVRNLAEAAGGALRIDARRFALCVPAADRSVERPDRSGAEG